MQRPSHTPTPDLIDPESRLLIEEFVATSEGADTTLDKRRAHLTEFATWLHHPNATHPLGETACPLARASSGQVHLFLAYLRGGDRFAGPPGAKHRELSPSSRKGYLASLRRFYEHLQRMNVIVANPTVGIRAPRIPRRAGFRLAPEELQRLLDARGSARDRIQTHLLVYTAARTGSLRTLTWSDVDWTNRLLLLHGKNDTTHIVNIHPVLLRELHRWHVHQQLDAQRNPAIARALADPETAFVLLTQHGRPLSKTSIYKQLKRRASTAGLYVLDANHREHRSLVTPHAIRRSIATMLLNDGTPLDAVADLLNHRQVDTTRTHYAYASPDRRRHTIESIQLP